jgi:acyl-CoA synthetase (AMP-forming)/AMP-acid ligase II
MLMPDFLWNNELRRGDKLALSGKLGGFKIPRSVDFIEAIPRNASGKITKNPLREKYWAGRTRKI